MEIKINRIKIENFKGIKSCDLELNGNNATLSGQNGAGKTSTYDAFLWLLFGKDSTGRKDFGIRPLNENNEPIKGLVVCVEADLSVGHQSYVLRKEHHEKLTKGQFAGYESKCWIDDVPKKANQFAKFVSDKVDENVFKLLTDLGFFNVKMHWKDRREVLLEIAGEIGTPAGFDELIELMGNRSVDDYKKVLAAQKKGLHDEQNQINPRIDELNRNLVDAVDAGELEAQRESAKKDLAQLDEQRKAILDSEKARQIKIDKLNTLKGDKSTREADMKSDTSSIDALFTEKQILDGKISMAIVAEDKAGHAIDSTKLVIQAEKSNLNIANQQLDQIREDYKKVKETTDETKCYACEQELPADKIEQMAQDRKEELNNIVIGGNELKAKIDEYKANLAVLEASLAKQSITLESASKDAADIKAECIKRKSEIDTLIAERPAPDFAKDQQWQSICAAIETAEKAIGEPVTDQLEAIENKRNSLNEKITELNNSLAQSDRSKQDSARIKELETKETQIGQQITETDRLISMIGDYKAAESNLITDSVNGMFKHTTFKLFKTLINGEIEDCCEAMLNGRPYSELSTGEKIFVGVDIVNVLSKHHDASVPMFVDHAESVTLPIESNSQTVKLMAVEKVEKVTLHVNEKATQAA